MACLIFIDAFKRHWNRSLYEQEQVLQAYLYARAPSVGDPARDYRPILSSCVALEDVPLSAPNHEHLAGICFNFLSAGHHGCILPRHISGYRVFSIERNVVAQSAPAQFVMHVFKRLVHGCLALEAVQEGSALFNAVRMAGWASFMVCYYLTAERKWFSARYPNRLYYVWDGEERTIQHARVIIGDLKATAEYETDQVNLHLQGLVERSRIKAAAEALEYALSTGFDNQPPPVGAAVDFLDWKW